MGKLGVFMLEVKGIGYRFERNSWLFRDVNLTVHPGEIVGIYGTSGSGKTTMAKIIAGYLKAQEGFIRVDGEVLNQQGVRNPVQLVWQHPEKVINPRWRMKDVNVEVGGFDPQLLELFGIHDEWLSRRPDELSGGELQRFCLARTLGSHTKYVIADEMTTMLDAITQAQIWHAVLQLVKDRQIGVLAVSHDHHLLNRVSDRIVHFNSLVGSS